MPRYVAFLRGVSPLNVKMPELQRCFEHAGFSNVRTVLTSGNVVFDSRRRGCRTIEAQAERAMQECLGRQFYPIVRTSVELQELVKGDPYADYFVPPAAKRVVSFLRDTQPPRVVLPLTEEGAHVCCVLGREVYSFYLPSPKGPVFIRLIEKAFGRDITTRTWDTVQKGAGA